MKVDWCDIKIMKKKKKKPRTEWGHHKIWGGDIILPVLKLKISAALKKRSSCFIVLQAGFYGFPVARESR